MVACRVARPRTTYPYTVDLYEPEQMESGASHGLPFRRITFQGRASWATGEDWNKINERLALVGYRVSKPLDRAKLQPRGEYQWRAGASQMIDRHKPGQRAGRIGTFVRPLAVGPGPDEPVKSRGGVKVQDWPRGRPKEKAPPAENPITYWWRVTLFEHDEGRIKDSSHPFRSIQFRVPSSWENRPDRAVIDKKLAKVGYRVSSKLDRRAKLKAYGGEYDWMAGASSYRQHPGEESISRVGDMERPFVAGPGPEAPVKGVRGVTVTDWPFGRPREKKPPTENPPWVDKAIKSDWPLLLKAVGKKWLPPRSLADDAASRYDQLGVGHYGAVFRTGTPGVVLKVTSDPDEVRFIVAGMSLGKWPAGVVRYYDLMRLQATHRKRPVYAIWREEAVSTGDLMPELTARPQDRRWQAKKIEFGALLYVFLLFARQIRDSSKRMSTSRFYAEIEKAEGMDVWDEAAHRFEQMLPLYKRGFARREWTETPRLPYRGTMRLAVALKACHLAAEHMEHSEGAVAVGEALSFYLDHGILLADVHTFNIGQVKRGNQTRTVITDPGHSVFLNRKFDRLLRDISDPKILRRRVKKLPKTTPNPDSAFRRLMRL